MGSKDVRHDSNMLMIGCSGVNHFIRVSRRWLHQYIHFNITRRRSTNTFVSSEINAAFLGPVAAT